MTNRLFLEDLYVGKKFSSAKYHVSEQQIMEFASAYDPQPFHIDPAKADESFFKGHAASGWQTAAITMRLIVTSVLLDYGIIGIGGDLTWLKPVRPGDTLQAKTEVTEIQISKSKPDRGIVTLLVQTENQHGDLVQSLSTKIMVFGKNQQPLLN